MSTLESSVLCFEIDTGNRFGESVVEDSLRLSVSLDDFIKVVLYAVNFVGGWQY